MVAEKQDDHGKPLPDHLLGKHHCGGVFCDIADVYSLEACPCSCTTRCGPWNGYLEDINQGRPPETEPTAYQSASDYTEGQIIRSSYACTQRNGAAGEVIIYAQDEDLAKTTAANHFKTWSSNIKAHKYGHYVAFMLDRGLPTQRLVEKYLITDPKYEHKYHVDQGVAVCDCCVDKACPAHIYQKKQFEKKWGKK